MNLLCCKTSERLESKIKSSKNNLHSLLMSKSCKLIQHFTVNDHVTICKNYYEYMDIPLYTKVPPAIQKTV